MPFKTCLMCHGWPDHRPGCEMAGFPETEDDGHYDAQKVMDFVKTRNMERAEAIIDGVGHRRGTTDAVGLVDARQRIIGMSDRWDEADDPMWLDQFETDRILAEDDDAENGAT
ncbi:hypothetical protein [Mycobacterium sp. E1747]|uniref:hypothetical protein n=1 Tax=Mycobacterium sp. E1747 TaxID=1834128 RepID=UPI0018D430C0|nr:hypothetical protein [Mycobacterium sp. E1747]